MTEYMSSDGMQSAIFGPMFWAQIHLVSFNYPVKPTKADKTAYRQWLLSLGKVLPCRYCRENFAKNLRSARFSESCFASRHAFSHFCYRLHDAVNRMLGKTSPTFEQVRHYYENCRASCLSPAQRDALAQRGEPGCIRPLHSGARGKAVIRVVPFDTRTPPMAMSHHCCRASPAPQQQR